MALDLTNPNHQIGTIVLFIEILLITLLFLARFNIRRLKINNHHYLVYSIVSINSLIILLWMLPAEFRTLDRLISGSTEIARVWHIFIHAFLGSTAIICGIILCSVFFLRVVRKDLIPLGLIKRMRPLMITTFIFWTLAFIFGLYVYINKYIL